VLLWALLAIIMAALGIAPVAPATAANRQVNIWLTTTDDPRGRDVVRGLQRQLPISLEAASAPASQTITVHENTTYQQFVGGGASFTDTAAWLMDGSGVVSPDTRDLVMTALFDPAHGIGLSFLRNPMGASDLARHNYSYDDVPPGHTDPKLSDFTIGHDLTGILPLTRQAERLNPDLTLMIVPWSAPAWMKDNHSFGGHGSLQPQYYKAYAQYFVKTIQAYQRRGVHVDYVSAQNEPGCCRADTAYGSMNWTGSSLDWFATNDLLPAFHAAGIDSKLLLLDYNWSNFADLGSVPIADAALTSDSDFGGIAWHGYGGNVADQTEIHDQYPDVPVFDTEHTGGTWIGNQQREDMDNIISYTRNWGRTVTKWSLAVDQNMGPHNGGCDRCSGLLTVHDGDGRSGHVDFTVEYYDMGQLTKFVRPGAYRIESNNTAGVSDVAWKNPDGSIALVAYNGTSSAQSVKIVSGGDSFTYAIPAATSATFTWQGGQH
jgi:glucosylceramidase